jgi:hypothetical protein
MFEPVPDSAVFNVYHIIEGMVERVTPKAVLFLAQDEDFPKGRVWIPRNCIEYGRSVFVGEQDLSISEWWLLKGGWV